MATGVSGTRENYIRDRGKNMSDLIISLKVSNISTAMKMLYLTENLYTGMMRDCLPTMRRLEKERELRSRKTKISLI